MIQRKHKIGGKTLTVQKVMEDDTDEDETDEEDEVDAPARAIEVTGFKSTTHHDTLMMYFESHKSAGGEIADFAINAKRNTATVSFVDPTGKDFMW